MEDEKTIILRKPVILGGVTYDVLELREPNAGELDKSSRADSNIGGVISLISIIAKVPRGAVEKISQRDLQECSDFLASFTMGLVAGGEITLPE